MAKRGSSFPEFEVQVRLRNNLLVQRREELGLNQIDCARAMKIHINTYNSYECLREFPLNLLTGDWKRPAKRIAKFWGESPEALWPEVIRSVKKAVLRFRIDGETVNMLMGEGSRKMAESPEELYQTEERDAFLKSIILEGLTEQEAQAIFLKYDFYRSIEKREQVAQDIGFADHDRTKLLVDGALKKLRHYDYSRPLKAYQERN